MELLTNERNQAVLAAFHKSMEEMRNENIPLLPELIICRAVEKPAPRFYTSFEKAARFISMIHRGFSLPLKNKNKIEMYHEIYRRFKITCDKYGTNYKFLEEIINQEAPEFYISKETFRRCIYSALKTKKKCIWY